MKCMKCNKNEANVYISTNINGRIKKECLCEECARDMDMQKFIDMDKIFATMFNKTVSQMDNMLMPARMHRFLRNDDLFFNNFFNDIKSFDDVFEGFKIGKQLETEVEDTVRIKEENKINKNTKEKKDKSISDLKDELQKAIKEERYEDAAILRDKINDKSGK